MEKETFNENRVVIKLGSSTVVDINDNIRPYVLDSVALQASQLIDDGFEIALVTSGEELAQAFEKYGKKTSSHTHSKDVQEISSNLQSRDFVTIIDAPDNDELSASLARSLAAGKLILISPVDGVWDKQLQVIEEIKTLQDLNRIRSDDAKLEVEAAANFAVGGRIAWIASLFGRTHSLLSILRDEQVGTRIRMS